MMEAPYTRRADPHTSYAAARSIEPKLPSIRTRVLEFARGKGWGGFTDEELQRHFNSPGSSFRTRRAELTEENQILDSKRTKPNGRGLDCVVWVHRDYHNSPPPRLPRKKQEAGKTANFQSYAAFLDNLAARANTPSVIERLREIAQALRAI